MKICICGGGNLGHVIAGFVAAQKKHEVCLLTRHPERWSQDLYVEAPDGVTYAGHLSGIYGDARQAVAHADIVLLCLPGYAISEALQHIKDWLRPDAAVGSVVCSTGFFFEALDSLSATQPLFGFQRVPFIARVVEYGRRARLMGYKDCLNMAVEHCDNPRQLRDVLTDILQTPIRLLGNYYEASLSNSNPLLHPSRLYSLWKDWHEGMVYDRIPLFYEEWTEEAAQLYISMDNELQELLRQLPVAAGSIATVLDYYESTDALSLAHKLQGIEAFKGIPAPMKPSEGGFVPDFHSRYFTEDFPYGLAIVHRLAKEHQVDAPHIGRVLKWGMNHIKLLLLLLTVSVLTVACSTDDDYTEPPTEEVTAQSPTGLCDSEEPDGAMVVSPLFDGELLFINHRGLTDYPENTFVAVNAAVLSGFKAVECDVCMTRDSVFVLQHDATIDRCSNGVGRVNDMTYEELLAYDFGSWKDSSFAGEPVARLDDVLDLMKAKGLVVELDLADESRFHHEWLPALYALVKRKGMLGQTMFTATQYEFQDFLSVPRDIIISVSGIIHRGFAEQALFLKDRVTRCNFSVSKQMLTSDICGYAHANGVKIKTWTTTTREENDYCRDMGADYIITEVPYDETVTTGMPQIHV